MAKSRREQEKAKRRKVKASAWAKKEESGGPFGATELKLPEGVEFFKLEAGKHVLDFMPYIVGKGNPAADEGFPHFEREYYIHQIPTPNGTRKYVCGSCFQDAQGKPKFCYICNWLMRNGRTADPKLVQGLRASQRHLWVVNPKPGTPPGTPKNPWKVYSTNHRNKGKGFGEQMKVVINSKDKYDDFSDLESGFNVVLTAVEDTFPLEGGGTGKYILVSRIDFDDRGDYVYDDELLDQAPCLDACLVETSTEDFKRILDQGEPEDEQEEEAPTRGVKRKDPDPDDEEEEDEDEEPEAPKVKGKTKPSPNGENLPRAADLGIKKGAKVAHPEHGLCDVVHVSSDGTSLRLEDSDGETHEVVGPEEVTLVGTGLKKGPAKPSPKTSPKSKKPDPDEEEDEDEPDEDSEDEEEDDEIEFDDDEDEDDSDSFQDEEDDEPPPPKKKPGRPPKKK